MGLFLTKSVTFGQWNVTKTKTGLADRCNDRAYRKMTCFFNIRESSKNSPDQNLSRSVVNSLPYNKFDL